MSAWIAAGGSWHQASVESCDHLKQLHGHSLFSASIGPRKKSAGRLEGFGDFGDRWDLVEGLRIYARVSQVPHPTKLPLVLIHGLGVSGRYMMPTAERLARCRPVLVPDLPGFGQSDKARAALDVPQIADLLAKWLPRLGYNRAAFLGNSLGCQVIVDFAVRYPECIDRAVLIAPTVDRRHPTMPRQLLRGFRDLWREPWSLWPILASDYWTTGSKRMYQTFRSALRDPVEEKLPHMKCPTLVVRGARDPIVPQRWAQEVAALLPKGRLVILQGAAHAANYAAPEALTRAVCPFLTEPSPRQP